jgi:hypothetical protein
MHMAPVWEAPAPYIGRKAGVPQLSSANGAYLLEFNTVRQTFVPLHTLGNTHPTPMSTKRNRVQNLLFQSSTMAALLDAVYDGETCAGARASKYN